MARNIGRKRALEMALTGDAIDAATAAEWGLINRAVPDDQLDDAVADLLARATRGSVLSKALGKRAFYAQVDLDQDAAYAYAVEVMASGGDDRRRPGGHSRRSSRSATRSSRSEHEVAQPIGDPVATVANRAEDRRTGVEVINNQMLRGRVS